MKSAIIFAPFWRQAGHVGNNRVERFVRWLAEDGFRLVMIRAGSDDGQQQTSWGTEITVRDPLGLYRDVGPAGVVPLARKPNKLRRALSYWLFNPDPSIVWARRAARHSAVLEAAVDASFILSSSPPESAHVGAWELSRRLGLAHIVDMRDGWLDEPLKPLLHRSAFRRWQEGRLESKILHDARAILVTSDVWLELLGRRMPQLADKLTVLTNGYPPAMPAVVRAEHGPQRAGLLLIHAGRFLGSSLSRSPDILLTPLLDALAHHPSQGTIRLVGPLTVEEQEIIRRFAAPFSEHGWHIECPGNLPRNELLQSLPQAGGLLLLSASWAAVPSKLYEYIPTGRPILAVADPGSAVWRIVEGLPQAHLVPASGGCDSKMAVHDFLDAAALHPVTWRCPEEFSEEYLGKIMRGVVVRIQNGGGMC